MTVAVAQFGGSNCDRDAVRALRECGIDAERVWHADGLPADLDGVLLPGGFSYGDYLRAGAMAARTPILAAIREATTEGTPVLGVCNGAQIGCESGLASGAFTTNRDARFHSEHVMVRVERADTIWTREFEVGEVIELPIAHGEGRFVPERGADAVADDRVLFRYCEPDGDITDTSNPNGSAGNVAGVVGHDPGVAVLMPHPERAAIPELGGTDGRPILRGFERAID